jgi:hypothetical protein
MKTRLLGALVGLAISLLCRPLPNKQTHPIQNYDRSF